MSNPHVQVALTYIRRTARIVAALACIAVGLLVILWIAMFVAFSCGGKIELSLDIVSIPAIALLTAASSALHSVRMSLVLVLILSLAAAGHLREQFANPRARMLPGFARVHIAVGAAVVLCVAVFIPALLAWLADCDRFAFLAIAVFISGAVLWAGSFRWMGWLAAVALYFCIGASSDGAIGWLSRALVRLVSGRAVGAAIVFTGLGALMILLTSRRLIRLNEEMFGYDRPTQTGGKVGAPVRLEGRGRLFRFLQVLKGFNEERDVSRILRHARGASASSWSRTCRWQVGMPTGRSLWLFCLVAILVAQLLFGMLTEHSRWQWDSRALLLLTSLPWLILVPATSLAMFYQRRQLIGHELLMPVARGAYFRELGWAALLAQLQLWSAAAAAIVLWWLIAARQSVPVGTVMGVLACSALFQFTLFGVAVWLTRYPALLLLLFILAMVGVVPITGAGATIARWVAERPYVTCSAGVAILAALDFLLIRSAYRRWLASDLE
jgi:hypothetical protein